MCGPATSRSLAPGSQSMIGNSGSGAGAGTSASGAMTLAIRSTANVRRCRYSEEMRVSRRPDAVGSAPRRKWFTDAR